MIDVRTVVIAVACAATLVVARSASANPRPLPFTYPYETLPEKTGEAEQYVDLTPARIVDPDDPTGVGRLWDQQYRLQTEFELGITNRLELGLYLVLANDAGGALAFDGVKQRLRYRFAEEGEWPVDVAVYGEIAEFHDELEFEQKLILGKRFGRFRAMTNLWFEEALEHYKGELEFKFRPTVGLTAEIVPAFHVGAEYWGIMPFENAAAAGTVAHFNGSFHHYVGPTAMLQSGRFWWSTGAYLRLDDMSRSTDVGDQYGHVWVRTIIGVSL